MSAVPRKPRFGSLKALTGCSERTPDTRAGLQRCLWVLEGDAGYLGEVTFFFFSLEVAALSVPIANKLLSLGRADDPSVCVLRDEPFARASLQRALSYLGSI